VCKGGEIELDLQSCRERMQSVRIKKDRDWRDYPIGTKAHAFDGGHWIRVERGWKWFNGSTFPTPGADAIGDCIELPKSA
jgi:hypothetical protein